MKIAIDARQINSLTGKGRYMAEIVKNLLKTDSHNEYFLLVHDEPKINLSGNYKNIFINKPVFTFVPQFFKKEKIDIFFSPVSFLLTFLSPVKVIMVVHDLAVFIEKEARPALKTKLMEKVFLRLAINKAVAIITVSENTKKDLIRLFPKSKSKTISISLASFSLDNKPVNIEKFNLPEKFILFVGTLEPRKNVGNLVKAFSRLEKPIQEKVPLVLVGKKGWNMQAIEELIKKNPNIFELGFVTDPELQAIYRQASLFVYPSWYEGFGLPVLEAMKHGLPVITSGTSSLPEVGGEAAMYIDPSNVKEIQMAMTKVLTDKNIRQEMSQKSLKQASNFSWEKTAKLTLAVLERVGQ